MTTLLETALHAHSIGWWLTPLNGKRPVLKGWTELPRQTEIDVRAWVAGGANIGVRTGPEQGIYGIDVEGAAPSPDDGLGLTDCPRSRTPSGGWHHYYAYPEGLAIGNTCRLLAPHTDTRGKGGQLVLPGSVVDGREYEWDVVPGEGELPQVPQHVLDRLMPRPRGRDWKPRPPAPGDDRWATAALKAELDEVAAQRAGDGRAHSTMCRAAFKIGQIAGAGLLELDAAIQQLVAAAESAGWDTREALRVATDCATEGARHPRGPRDSAPPRSPIVAANAPETSQPVDVLLPGSHVLPNDDYVEQSNDGWAEQALALVPRVYRRDLVVGRVDEEEARFVPLNEDAMRRECDKPRVRPVKWVMPKGKDAEPACVYVPCPTGAARLVLSRAAETAPAIKLLVPYPVLVGGRLAPMGYDPETLTYRVGFNPPPLRGRLRTLMEDALADFPFEDQGSFANFLGLLLTPIVRPTVGPAPMHIVDSPQPGTGKSILVEYVLGLILTGRGIPSSPLPERPEERSKWLTALLIGGKTFAHLDNLTAELDSGALASLVTSSTMSDRLLGTSTFLELPNNLTIAATGNNTNLSSELARRSVIVRLWYRGPGRPDERTDFRHPHPEVWAAAKREELLGALVGAVQDWLDAGQPLARAAGGSFDRWAGVVGGILEVAGIEGHLANRAAWRERVDAEEAALSALAAAWAARFGPQPVTASEALAALGDAVGAVLERPSIIALGRLLSRSVDREFAGGWRWKPTWSSNRSRAYQLEPVSVSLEGAGAPHPE